MKNYIKTLLITTLLVSICQIFVLAQHIHEPVTKAQEKVALMQAKQIYQEIHAGEILQSWLHNTLTIQDQPGGAGIWDLLSQDRWWLNLKSSDGIKTRTGIQACKNRIWLPHYTISSRYTRSLPFQAYPDPA